MWQPLPLTWVIPPAGGRWTCLQQRLISAQGGPEEKEDNPEDPGNGPYSSRESSLDTATRCSKEPSTQPAAISFLGALRIPVRSLWNGGRWEALQIFLLGIRR